MESPANVDSITTVDSSIDGPVTVEQPMTTVDSSTDVGVYSPVTVKSPTYFAVTVESPTTDDSLTTNVESPDCLMCDDNSTVESLKTLTNVDGSVCLLRPLQP